MKILFTYQYYPRYRERLFRLLDEESDFEIDFWLGDSTLRHGLPRADHTLLRSGQALRNVWFARKIPGGPFLWQRGLLAAVLRSDADLVVFTGNWRHISTWLAATIARARRLPTIFHTMGWRGKTSRGERLVKRLFYSLADHLFLYGNVARDVALKQGIPSERLHVVYNSTGSIPVPRATFGPSERGRDALRRKRQGLARLGLAPDHLTLVCVSRIEPRRRLELLIRAAGILTSRGKPVNVLLVGAFSDDDLESELRRLAIDNNVRLAAPGPTFEASALREYYDLSDCSVVPGAAGLAVIQSLAYGTPVVTSDNWDVQGPEVEALVPGETGYFFEYGNVDSLVSSIEECLRLSSTPGVSEGCVDKVRRDYSAEAQVRAFGSGFHACVSGARGSRGRRA